MKSSKFLAVLLCLTLMLGLLPACSISINLGPKATAAGSTQPASPGQATAAPEQPSAAAGTSSPDTSDVAPAAQAPATTRPPEDASAQNGINDYNFQAEPATPIDEADKDKSAKDQSVAKDPIDWTEVHKRFDEQRIDFWTEKAKDKPEPAVKDENEDIAANWGELLQSSKMLRDMKADIGIPGNIRDILSKAPSSGDSSGSSNNGQSSAVSEVLDMANKVDLGRLRETSGSLSQIIVDNSDFSTVVLYGSGKQNLFGEQSDVQAAYTGSAPNQMLPLQGSLACPLMDRLGRGYDVFGFKANELSLKPRVLDLQRLGQDRRLEVRKLQSHEVEETIEQSLKSYVKKSSLSVSAEGRYFCFSADVSSAFDKEQRGERKNYFATIEHVVGVYNPYIVYMPTRELAQYVLPEVREDFRKYSAKEFVSKYGYYVLVNCIIGGKIRYDATNTSASSESFDAFSMDAKASCNALIASAKVNVKYSSEQSEKAFKATSRHKLSMRGAADSQPNGPQLENNQDSFNHWKAALQTHGVMVAFHPTEQSLIPIWTLFAGDPKADEIEDLFKGQSQSFGEELPDPQHFDQNYLQGLQLGIDPKKKSAAEQMAATGGAIALDPHLNLNTGSKSWWIFLGAKFGAPGAYENAITDLFIRQDYAPGDASRKFSHNGAVDTYAMVNPVQWLGKADYKRCDLNLGAGGNYIYLYATKALGQHKAPITAIQVYNAGSGDTDYDKCLSNLRWYLQENPGWEVVCHCGTNRPANLNDYCKHGNRLFLLVKKDYRILNIPKE